MVEERGGGSYNDVNNNEEDGPAGEGAVAPSELFVVEEPAEEEGAEDLGKPVEEAGERAGARVEHVQIIRWTGLVNWEQISLIGGGDYRFADMCKSSLTQKRRETAAGCTDP